MKPQRVVVNDSMHRRLVHFLTQPIDKSFYPDFAPQLTCRRCPVCKSG